MWEMLYSLLESEHHVILLLLVTLFPVFCSLDSSLTSLLTCHLFWFFFPCPYNFPVFFSFYTCFTPACWVFSSFATQLHICLVPSTFLPVGVDRSTGSPQTKCCGWPPDSSSAAVDPRGRWAVPGFVASSSQLVAGPGLWRARTTVSGVHGAPWSLFVLERMRAWNIWWKGQGRKSIIKWKINCCLLAFAVCFR